MSRRFAPMLAAAGAAAAAVGIYRSRQGKAAESQDGPSRNPAHTKRDLGLGGAGVGGNQVVGSTELGASHGRPDKDPEAKTGTTASPSEIPSGGVGGGEGAGGSNARRVQLPTTGKSQDTTGKRTSVPDTMDALENSVSSLGSSASTERPGVLGTLSGAFGHGGKRAADKAEDSVVHNTRDISKMGSEVPSKKRAPKASD